MKKLFFLSVLYCGLGQATPFIELHTNQGDILIELDEDNAPATVANFLHYANSGFYDGTVFHRVIDGFMIQGGGYDANLTLKPTQEPIANEAHNGLKNKRGTIAMARTNDPHSATSQFFINLTDNDFLDATASNPYGYAVFGQVIEGMSTVDTIANIPTGAKGPFAGDVPEQTVEIISTAVMESLDTPYESTGKTTDTKEAKTSAVLKQTAN